MSAGDPHWDSWSHSRVRASSAATPDRTCESPRPNALDEKKAALAQRMDASGESPTTIAATLGVSRATVYQVLAERTDET